MNFAKLINKCTILYFTEDGGLKNLTCEQFVILDLIELAHYLNTILNLCMMTKNLTNAQFVNLVLLKLAKSASIA